MGKLTDMIDSMIQEYAEEIPTTLVQRLGELRKEMTTKYSGDPSSIVDKVSQAAKKIADDNNACMINIVTVDDGDCARSGTATCLRRIESNKVLDMILTIPKTLHGIVESIDENVPGFKQKAIMSMTMLEMQNDPMSKLQDLLGNIGMKR